MRQSPIGQLIGVVIGAIAAWSWFAYAPPYSWLAELQLNTLGVHHPLLTFMATMLVVGLPVGLGLRALGVDPEGAHGRLGPFLVENRGVMWAVVGGLVLAVMGGHDLFDASRIGSVCMPTELSSLRDGHTPESRWVELSGYTPDPDRGVTFTENGRERMFVPLVVRSASESPVVVVDVDSYEVGQVEQREPLRGVLRSDRVPGEVRAQLGAAGLARGSYWVLDLGDSPELRRTTGRAMTPIGLLLLIGGLVVGVRRWRA